MNGIRLAGQSGWCRAAGLGRSIMALSTLLTLLTNPLHSLIEPAADGPTCTRISSAGLFCVLSEHPGAAKSLAILVLIAVATGGAPKWTACPHWYIAWSVGTSLAVIDGGDQILLIMTLLLIPVCFLWPGNSHWGPVRQESPRLSAVWMLVRLQVSLIYLNAAIAKMGVADWANGTAPYYWLVADPTFKPQLLGGVWRLVLLNPVGVMVIGYGTIVLELALGGWRLIVGQVPRVLLIVGIIFHLGIAVSLEIPAFGVAMVGLLLFTYGADWQKREGEELENDPGNGNESAAREGIVDVAR